MFEHRNVVVFRKLLHRHGIVNWRVFLEQISWVDHKSGLFVSFLWLIIFEKKLFTVVFNFDLFNNAFFVYGDLRVLQGIDGCIVSELNWKIYVPLHIMSFVSKSGSSVDRRMMWEEMFFQYEVFRDHICAHFCHNLFIMQSLSYCFFISIHFVNNFMKFFNFFFGSSSHTRGSSSSTSPRVSQNRLCH